MTDNRDRSDPIARWHAIVAALEAAVLAALDQPEIDPAEADEVRRLVAMRLAAARPNKLPAAWARRPGIVPHLVPDEAVAPEATERAEPTPPSPSLPSRPPPAWRE